LPIVRIQNLRDFSSLACRALHCIAFPVVSKWCQLTSIFGPYAEEESLSSCALAYEGLRSVRGLAVW
jgi:hypothetical protein